MQRRIWTVALSTLVLLSSFPSTTGKDIAKQTLKEQERYTLSLELQFAKKNRNAFQRAISLLNFGPNGYATGFLVGDRLAMTAYHVVSGELSDSKKLILGFKPDDQLEVKVYVNGCQANVIKVDESSDLALLSLCGPGKKTRTPSFQPTPSKDERLFLIAKPHGDKMVSLGFFHGAYTFKGQEYWSARLEGRDGYSGSPVYNQNAEVVGVFSGYDWNQKVALISPSIRAQKLLEDYISSGQP